MKTGDRAHRRVAYECPFFKEEKPGSHYIMCQLEPGGTTITQGYGPRNIDRALYSLRFCQSVDGCKECWIYKHLWEEWEKIHDD